MMTLREALRQPLRKPAIRKLKLLFFDRPGEVEQWFVLEPSADPDVNAIAWPCRSFEGALSILRRLLS